MLSLSLKELKVVAKMRGIKGLTEDELLTALNLSKISFSKARILHYI